MMEHTIRRANKLTASWGGRFYFVLLPSYYYYSDEIKPKNIAGVFEEVENRTWLLKLMNKLNVPIIDIHENGFGQHADPLSLFPFRICGLYTSEGYNLVARAILKKLEYDLLID